MDGGEKQKQTAMVRDREAERALKRTRGFMNLASHDTPAFRDTYARTDEQTRLKSTTTDKENNNWRCNEC